MSINRDVVQNRSYCQYTAATTASCKDNISTLAQKQKMSIPNKRRIPVIIRTFVNLSRPSARLIAVHGLCLLLRSHGRGRP